MTYRELVERIKELPDERMDDDVSVYVSENDEFMPVISAEIILAHSNNSCVLDVGHCYIVI